MPVRPAHVSLSCLRLRWVVLLAFVGGSALAQPQMEYAAPLSGRVIDATGKPIAGAQITVDDHPELRATTRADGTFALDHVPAGASIVVASRK